MYKFTLKNGTEITYDTPFVFEDTYFRRVRVPDQGERFWMWVHPDDLADYDNDVEDYRIRLGVAANDALCGIPWGVLIPYKLEGTACPSCDMNKYIDTNEKPVAAHPRLIKNL